jgi:hypothetical protein
MEAGSCAYILLQLDRPTRSTAYPHPTAHGYSRPYHHPNHDRDHHTHRSGSDSDIDSHANPRSGIGLLTLTCLGETGLEQLRAGNPRHVPALLWVDR